MHVYRRLGLRRALADIAGADVVDADAEGTVGWRGDALGKTGAANHLRVIETREGLNHEQ